MKRKISFTALFLLLFSFICLINANASSYIYNGANIDAYLGVNDYYSSNNNYVVTDSSQFNSSQPYVTVNLTDYGCILDDLVVDEVETIMVAIKMYIREINDGYQEIYLYRDAAYNAVQLCNPITNFEHYPGVKNEYYQQYEFYAEINVSDLITSSFVIRFGAHGSGDDDWEFSGMTVEMFYSYDQRYYSSLIKTLPL